MLGEEFSFPIISNKNVTHLALATPSLWRISSLDVYPDLELDHQFEANGRKGFSTTSFRGMIGETEQRRDMHHVGLTRVEAEVENKMDLLWEDFNDEDDDEVEESESKFSLDISGLDHQESSEESDLEDAGELLYVQASEMSKTSTAGGGGGGLVVSQKKNKTILVLKAFMNKLLLMHNIGRSKKYRS